jgi:aryl-alcohol dehydrogenase-like predicted oxidoreductase
MDQIHRDGRVQLGKTDLHIPALGIGTWAWGDKMMWGFGKGYGEADLRGAFRASLDSGIEFFDTAEVYGSGRSEQFLGQFLAEDRREVIIATKFMPFPWHLRRDSLVEALKRSLARLGLERVDLYQIHWPFPPVSIETWMAGMADAVQAGLTRAVGVSNYNVQQMSRAHTALAKYGIPLASNQVQYSLLHRHPERSGLLQACEDLGVTLIAYSPLAQGLLSDKYGPDNPLPGLRGRRSGRTRLAEIRPLVALLGEIGQAHGGKTPAQAALNWSISKGSVPIPGAKNASQARENAGALGWRMSHDEVAALDAASDRIAGKAQPVAPDS